MRILMIGTDHRLADTQSDLFRRQLGYIEGHEMTLLILSTQVSEDRTVSGVRLIGSGGKNKAQSFFRARKILRHLSDQFDLVSTQDVMFTGWLGLWFSRRRHIPLFVQLHGDYLDNPLWIGQRPLNRILNWAGKNILKKAKGIRVVSERIKRDLVAHYHISADRILSLPICTDLSIFTTQGEQKSGGPHVFFVGRLIDEKDPLMFCRIMIRIMKEHETVKAIIAGDGNLRPQMEHLFREAGYLDRAMFLGNVSAPELAIWYRSSVCNLHTAPWEGWGMPMIEAMACGCPVVTTDTGCAGEAVRDHEQGLVYPVGDEQGLYEGTKYLLTHTEERDQYAKRAVEEAQRWSFQARKGDLMKFYAKHLT